MAEALPENSAKNDRGSGANNHRPRKISLPWFRQSSFGIGAATRRLPKQHTIAVPPPERSSDDDDLVKNLF